MKKVKYEVIQGWLNRNYDGDFITLAMFDTKEEAEKLFEKEKENKHQERIDDHTPFYFLQTEILESLYEVENDNEELDAFNLVKSESINCFCKDFRPSQVRKGE